MGTLESLREAGRHCQHVFEQLGDRVEQEWLRTGFDDKHLPRIAASALAEHSLHKQVKPADIAAWVVTSQQMGAQPNARSGFGQPPVTLYKGRRFYIEVLQWLNSTTSVHQHGFAGAFTVLYGGSVQTTYRFDEHARLAQHMMLGDVHAMKSEVLRAGDVRMIDAGRDFIHALYHMEHPSLSVVVRSDTTPNAELQYNYVAPYVAYNPFDDDLWVNNTTGYLRGLLASQSREVLEIGRHAVSQADPRWAFSLLTAFAFPSKDDSGLSIELTETMKAAARDKFGEHYKGIELSLLASRRITEFNTLRNNVKDPAERFFLALLMNVPDRMQLLDLVHQRFPNDDPAARIEDWLRALTDEKEHRANIALGSDALLLLPSIVRDEPFEKALWRLEAVHGKLDEEDHVDIKATIEKIKSFELLQTFSGKARPLPYKQVRGT